MSAVTTCVHCERNSFDVARPMADDAPVIIETLSLSSVVLDSEILMNDMLQRRQREQKAIRLIGKLEERR